MALFVVCGFVCAALAVANIGLARTNLTMRHNGLAALCSMVAGLSLLVVAYCVWKVIS